MAEKANKITQIYREDVEKSNVHTNPRPNTERPSYETIKPTQPKPAKPKTNTPTRRKNN
ncbi:MAG: hypothetical protein ABUK01_10045 [Leptospirales bacterium]